MMSKYGNLPIHIIPSELPLIFDLHVHCHLSLLFHILLRLLFHTHPESCLLLVKRSSCTFFLYQTSPLSGILEDRLAIQRLQLLKDHWLATRPTRSLPPIFPFRHPSKSTATCGYGLVMHLFSVPERCSKPDREPQPCHATSSTVGRSLSSHSSNPPLPFAIVSTPLN